MRLSYFSALAAALCLCSPMLAITKEEALRRLGEHMGPSSSTLQIAAYMEPTPRAFGTVTPSLGAGPTVSIAGISGNPQWVALVDYEPCAFWNHRADWVFIDDVTGARTVVAGDAWPQIDGVAMGDGTGASTNLIRLFSLRPDPRAPIVGRPTGPIADYGDAPDGQTAYWNPPGLTPVTGLFPTKAASTVGLPGARARITGQEVLGGGVTVERDAIDPADPDGRPNLLDGDRDERMFLAWEPTSPVSTAWVIYDVRVAAGAAAGARYVNVLVDLNRSGQWNNPGPEGEWVVANQAVLVAPGTSRTLITPAFGWSPLTPLLTHTWMRVALSRHPIPAALYPGGWNGSGNIRFGEIEDFCVVLRECNRGCPEFRLPPPPPWEPGDDDDDNPPGGGGGPPPPPGPEIGWDGTPIQCFALIITGKDNPGTSFVHKSGEVMASYLGGAGWSVTRLKSTQFGAGPADVSSPANICAAIAAIAAAVKCQDKVLIYICAHGAKNSPDGRMKMGDGSDMSGDDLDTCLDQIPPCPPGGELCDLPNVCCNVTVILESCYSGQMEDNLEERGRRIITTSGSNHPSWATYKGGGIYTSQFINCMKNSSSDTNGDGRVDPSEAHECAKNIPGHKAGDPSPQTPIINSDTCDCFCPILIPPPDCPDWVVIYGDGIYPWNNVGAGTGPQGQSNPECLFFGSTAINNDVWWCWVAETAGTVTMSTCGLTTIDTKMAVYAGPDCDSLGPPVACNDDAGGTCGLRSTVTFQASQGQAFLVQLGGFNNAAQGQGQLQVTTTPACDHDTCNNPYLIPIQFFGPGSEPFPGPIIPWDNRFATGTQNVAGQPECDGLSSFGRDLWFRVLTPHTGRYTIDTLGLTSVDTVLAVWQGFDCLTRAPMPVACQDDAAPSVRQSWVSFTAAAGEAYLVQLGSFGTSPGGTGGLRLHFMPNCPPIPPEWQGMTLMTEPEFCGSPNINPGCDADGPPQFMPFNPDSIVLGGTWADAGAADSDWFLLPLPPGIGGYVAVRSDVPMSLRGAAADCVDIELLELSLSSCQPITVTHFPARPPSAPPAVFGLRPELSVGPIFDDLECDGPPPLPGYAAAFWLEPLQLPIGACCLGSECFVTDINACGLEEGVFQGSGTACPASGTCCPADYNGQDGITVQDIYDFLFDWNNVINGNPPVIGNPDFNGSGDVTVQDIYDFLFAWNEGC